MVLSCSPWPGRLLLQVLGSVEHRSPAEGAIVCVCQLVTRLAEDTVATWPVRPRRLTCVAPDAQGVRVEAHFTGIDSVSQRAVSVVQGGVLVLQGSMIRS